MYPKCFCGRWGSSQRSPRPPSWSWGPLRGREGRGTGREGKEGGKRKVKGWRKEEGKEREGRKGGGKQGEGKKGEGKGEGKRKPWGAGVVVLGVIDATVAFHSNYGRIFSHFGDIQRQRMA